MRLFLGWALLIIIIPHEAVAQTLSLYDGMKGIYSAKDKKFLSCSDHVYYVKNDSDVEEIDGSCPNGKIPGSSLGPTPLYGEDEPTESVGLEQLDAEKRSIYIEWKKKHPTTPTIEDLMGDSSQESQSVVPYTLPEEIEGNIDFH